MTFNTTRVRSIRIAGPAAAVFLLGTVATVVVPPAPARASQPNPALRIPPPPPETVPTAAQKDTARTLFRQAKRDLAKHAYDSALPKLEAVFLIIPRADIALLRADVFERLDRHCDAFDALLAAGGLDRADTVRDRIVAGLAREGPLCGAGMAWAVVKIAPEQAAERARVMVSGREVPMGRAIGLPAGKYSVAVLAEGFQGVSDPVELAAGEGATYRYRLVAEPRVAAVATPPPATGGGGTTAAAGAAPELPDAPLVTEDTGSPVLGWSLVGGGVALAAAGVVMHLQANGTQSDIDAYVERVNELDSTRPPGWQEEYNEVSDKHADASSTFKTQRVVYIALYATAAVATATGTYLLLSSGSSGEASAVLAPFAAPGEAGLRLQVGW